MNVLFIGARLRNQIYFEHCLKKKYNVYVYEPNKQTVSNISKIMLPYKKNYLEDSFLPDFIINAKENLSNLEYDLNKKFICETMFCSEARDFFMYKSIQDKVCNELNIPTISNTSNNIIVKDDCGHSGGTNSYVCKRENILQTENIFIQDYKEIEYILSVHVYIDKYGIPHILTFGRMDYEDNCPVRYHTPYFPQNEQNIRNYVKKLTNRFKIRNRLIYWQFLNGQYHMDFNSRVSGGTENRTFDKDIGNYDIAECVLEQRVPDEIRYHTRIRLEYLEKHQFGYGPCDRFRVPLVYDKSSKRYEETAT